MQEREDETHDLLDAKRAREADADRVGADETSDHWHDRYLAQCTTRGLSTVGDKRYRWGKWISPRIGTKPIAKVTRSDIEDIRDDIDAAIREYEKHGPGDRRLAHKTGANV